jgi:lysophospholipase L1-like esterase
MTPSTTPTDNVVFLGDSLTEWFDLKAYFRDKRIINHGVSGDMTEHVIYRLKEITSAKPAVIFLMIGINDIFQEMDEETISMNQEHIIHRILTECPQTKLYVQSILPVNEERLVVGEDLNIIIRRLNTRLQDICKRFNVSYIDLYLDFLDDHGRLDSALTYDGGHLTPKGYDLWARLVKPYLAG